jgi:uncharacterized caspase-like protein
MIRRVTALLRVVLFATVPLFAVPAQAEVRALLWASDYANSGNPDLRLGNTLRDARAVADMLRKLDLKDVRLVENPSPEAWNTELEAMAQRLQPEDVALVYYAGHAVQISGRNYFLAADGTTLIASEDVLAPIMARAHGTVFLVDACRDNPFRDAAREQKNRTLKIGEVAAANASRAATRAISSVSLEDLAHAAGGLSQMGNLRGKNTIVLFSTDPGNVALDGDPGTGSPFANAVVRELGKRQSLDTAIRRITDEVDKRTGGRQSPWRQGDLTFLLFLAGQPRFPVP